MKTFPFYVGTATLVINLLFPPWVSVSQNPGSSGTQITKPLGYAPVFAPPQLAARYRDQPLFYGVAIDLQRLMVQTAALGIVVAITFRTRKKS